MSELYSIRVAALEGATVSLELTVVHPDAGRAPGTRAFALSLIESAWWLLEKGHVALMECCPFGAQEARELVATSPGMATIRRLRELLIGPRREITQEEFLTLERALKEGRPLLHGGAKVTSFGMETGSSYVILPDDFPAYEREAEKLVESVRLGEWENVEAFKAWPDCPDRDASTDDETWKKVRLKYERARPRARFIARFRGTELLGPIRQAMAWSTSAYR